MLASSILPCPPVEMVSSALKACRKMHEQEQRTRRNFGHQCAAQPIHQGIGATRSGRPCNRITAGEDELRRAIFRVTLIKKPEARVGEILSEGEHRCVALAAFLAELATADTHSAPVFDDPVSLLGHIHRNAVANRLAQEGLQRQIIVFTRDIAFLFLLYEACREKETHLAFRFINRGPDVAGFCHPNPTQNAQPVGKVIGSSGRISKTAKFTTSRATKKSGISRCARCKSSCALPGNVRLRRQSRQ